MDYKRLMDRIEDMSFTEFQEMRKTPEYRALNSEPSVKEEFVAVLGRRRSKERKRERILEALYGKPEVFEWLKDIQDYRSLRIEQAWISIAIREGENDSATKSSWESLDRRRRQVHNKALRAFCKLVEYTSPFSNRDNQPPADGSFYLHRDEMQGDLYDGPLMIPAEEPNNYGSHAVRDSMTNGMFQCLKLIEQTNRGDWDRLRSMVLEKLGNRVIMPPKDISDIQMELIRETRGYGMEEAPDKDDFSTDLFDSRDNKYQTFTKKSKKMTDMEFD